MLNKILEPALTTRDVPVPQHIERGGRGSLMNEEEKITEQIQSIIM